MQIFSESNVDEDVAEDVEDVEDVEDAEVVEVRMTL